MTIPKGNALMESLTVEMLIPFAEKCSIICLLCAPVLLVEYFLVMSLRSL